MDEDDFFPLLLSQRERSTFELGIQGPTNEVEGRGSPIRNEPPEDEGPPAD